MGYSAVVKKELKYTSTTVPPPITSEHDMSTAVQVDGMVCINCAQIIESSLRRMKGVKHISVSVEDKLAQVLHDPDLLTVRSICSAIEELGFEATLPESHPLTQILPVITENSRSVCSQQSCTMTIDGMTCFSCVQTIESHLSDMEAVESVQVLLQEKKGRMIYNAAITSPQNLLVAIEDLGYTVTHVDGTYVHTCISTYMCIHVSAPAPYVRMDVE